MLILLCIRFNISWMRFIIINTSIYMCFNLIWREKKKNVKKTNSFIQSKLHTCLLRWSLRIKRFPHIWHANRFSPKHNEKMLFYLYLISIEKKKWAYSMIKILFDWCHLWSYMSTINNRYSFEVNYHVYALLFLLRLVLTIVMVEK